LPIVSTFGTNDPDYFRALIQIEQNNFTKAADFLNSDIETVKNSRNELMRDYKLLADVYDRIGNAQLSKESYKKYIQLQDSLIADQRQFASVSFEVEQQMNEKELSINKLKNDNKIASITRNFIIGFAAMLLILAVSIYYRFQSKKKANAVLESTLSELKSTQSQLIQSEKMASLGELTAGIAHEIQNPLNFVNNFADVNVELIEELETEANKGNLEEVKLLAKDIKENETKITHHGKRADAIVKNMLQHSRKTSGQKELTDINALCDEYLRLSYHGLKAKDKSFNAEFETKFDTTLAPINVVPQDIGRVILNLINNAFYAVNERQKKEEDSGYKPLVTLTTSKQGDQVVIEVADNGTGMPEQVKEKIFQPFFTTKPTGEGTGLGLSLSYDFVTKGHGGIMEVLTREGEGSKIIVRLPF